MSAGSPARDAFAPGRFEAVLFDLDGVLTDTARLHAEAWKHTFDAVLEQQAAGAGFRPFDPVSDYRRYVDGRPRFDGVRAFLEARGIHLPEGDPADPPERDSVCGIGNRKNDRVARLMESEGVQAFPGSVAWLRQVRAEGLRTAVVSASENCQAVLRAAGIEELFDARVDGLTLTERGLPGKPAPDSFLEAARELGVAPERAVVVEDALAGVEAGAAGGFGLVIGVARKDDADDLARHGAHLVVLDLAEMLEEGRA